MGSPRWPARAAPRALRWSRIKGTLQTDRRGARALKPRRDGRPQGLLLRQPTPSDRRGPRSPTTRRRSWTTRPGSTRAAARSTPSPGSTGRRTWPPATSTTRGPAVDPDRRRAARRWRHPRRLRQRQDVHPRRLGHQRQRHRQRVRLRSDREQLVPGRQPAHGTDRQRHRGAERPVVRGRRVHHRQLLAHLGRGVPVRPGQQRLDPARELPHAGGLRRLRRHRERGRLRGRHQRRHRPDLHVHLHLQPGHQHLVAGGRHALRRLGDGLQRVRRQAPGRCRGHQQQRRGHQPGRGVRPLKQHLDGAAQREQRRVPRRQQLRPVQDRQDRPAASRRSRSPRCSPGTTSAAPKTCRGCRRARPRSPCPPARR